MRRKINREFTSGRYGKVRYFTSLWGQNSSNKSSDTLPDSVQAHVAAWTLVIGCETGVPQYTCVPNCLTSASDETTITSPLVVIGQWSDNDAQLSLTSQ